MRVKVMACALALAGLVLAGCGGGDDSGAARGSARRSGELHVYSSLPLQGGNKNQTGAMQKGMELAFDEAGNRAGDTHVRYISLDDSTAQAGNWDAAQTSQNARKAAQDPRAIAYLGEYNSGASAISIPILNQAGVPQISPTNTYVGLTTDEPGSERGEPEKYYPTGKRTYARIAPRDSIQGQALLTLTRQDGCKRVAIANDRETFGAGLARVMAIKAKTTGVNIVSNQGIEKNASNYRAYAQGVKSKGADCFVFAGVTANGGVQLAKDVATAVPGIRLYGPDGTCESGFTSAKRHGLPAAMAKQFQCTVATLNLQSYPGGQAFLARWKAKYGTTPDPYAIYGYDAANLVLAVINAGGTDKKRFVSRLFAIDYNGALGRFSFDKNGDSTLTDYGVYKVGPSGDPVFSKVIKGPK